MRKARNLTKKEQAAINRVEKAFKDFPKTLQVFAFSGTMMIVDMKTKQIFMTILAVSADGGDPGTVEENGVEFLDSLY